MDRYQRHCQCPQLEASSADLHRVKRTQQTEENNRTIWRHFSVFCLVRPPESDLGSHVHGCNTRSETVVAVPTMNLNNMRSVPVGKENNVLSFVFDQLLFFRIEIVLKKNESIKPPRKQRTILSLWLQRNRLAFETVACRRLDQCKICEHRSKRLDWSIRAKGVAENGSERTRTDEQCRACPRRQESGGSTCFPSSGVSSVWERRER